MGSTNETKNFMSQARAINIGWVEELSRMRQLGITTFQKTDTLCPCFASGKQNKRKKTLFTIKLAWLGVLLLSQLVPSLQPEKTTRSSRRSSSTVLRFLPTQLN